MAPILTKWTRLIRFVAQETSEVHIGQPVDPKLDGKSLSFHAPQSRSLIYPTVGLAAWNKQVIKAYEIDGSALDPAAQVTDTVLTVKELLVPLSREELKIVRCLGLNYSDHAAEAKMPIPVAPILFYKPLSAMIGPNAPICIPKIAQPPEVYFPDYEAELTVVIGKTAKNVSEEDALDYVLGYTAANDVSFRKHQRMTSQWGFSKGFDNTNPLGPCLVSNNAIPDPQVLPIVFKLNGDTLQNGNTKDQIFNVRQSIAALSQATTLEPGSIILTGTPAGVGIARQPKIVLKDGDDCRVWIGNEIGTLINPVIEEGKRESSL